MTGHGVHYSQGRQGQSGFSLLEMLVALAILSGVAYVALDTVELDTGQHRYELTEQRLAKIRRAIVGDPGLTLNGAPVISGYVADVGRLPLCLEQLVKRESDCGGAVSSSDYPQIYAEAFTHGFAMGWRGPYITANAENGLRDGWGTPQADEGNWNWIVKLPTNLEDDMPISSLGRDRVKTLSTDGEYFDQDDSNRIDISFNEYLVDFSMTGISYDLTNTGASPRDVCLAIVAPDPEETNEFLLHHSDPITVAGSGGTASGDLSATDYVPIGVREVLIYDADSTIPGSPVCTPNLSTFTISDILENYEDKKLGQIIVAAGIIPVSHFNVILD